MTSSELKAIYIGKFAKFITFNTKREYFCIGIVGDEALAKSITQIYKERTIDGKPVKVLAIYSLQDVSKNACQMVYIDAYQSNVEALIRRVHFHGGVTISADASLVDKGVMIGMIQHDKRITIELNKDSIDDALIDVSCHLFNAAKRIVGTK